MIDATWCFFAESWLLLLHGMECIPWKFVVWTTRQIKFTTKLCNKKYFLIEKCNATDTIHSNNSQTQYLTAAPPITETTYHEYWYSVFFSSKNRYWFGATLLWLYLDHDCRLNRYTFPWYIYKLVTYYIPLYLYQIAKPINYKLLNLNCFWLI